MKTNAAVYPGSFDPITNGHVDIILRGAEVFDRVIVLVAVNSEKKTLFALDERIGLIRQVFASHPNVEVDSFEGLLVNYLRAKKIRVVIRGLRAVSDFEYEFQMALMNKQLNKEIEVIFMVPDVSFTFLSSTIVKEVVELGGDVSDLVPGPVLKRLKEKYPGV